MSWQRSVIVPRMALREKVLNRLIPARLSVKALHPFEIIEGFCFSTTAAHRITRAFRLITSLCAKNGRR